MQQSVVCALDLQLSLTGVVERAYSYFCVKKALLFSANKPTSAASHKCEHVNGSRPTMSRTVLTLLFIFTLKVMKTAHLFSTY